MVVMCDRTGKSPYVYIKDADAARPAKGPRTPAARSATFPPADDSHAVYAAERGAGGLSLYFLPAFAAHGGGWIYA